MAKRVAKNAIKQPRFRKLSTFFKPLGRQSYYYHEVVYHLEAVSLDTHKAKPIDFKKAVKEFNIWAKSTGKKYSVYGAGLIEKQSNHFDHQDKFYFVLIFRINVPLTGDCMDVEQDANDEFLRVLKHKYGFKCSFTIEDEQNNPNYDNPFRFVINCITGNRY